MNKTKRVILKTCAAFTFGLVCWANTASASQNIDVTATLNPSASIELSNAGSFTVSPTSNGTFNHSDFDIKAYTNSLAGYTIVMTTTDTNLNLVNTTGSNVGEITTIPTLEENEEGYRCLTYAEEAAFLKEHDGSLVPECTFTANRWGIAVNSGNYFPAVSGMVINRTDKATGSTGEITTVKLGAKIGMLAASGTYAATLNFAIVANIPEEDNLAATSETVANGATTENQ